MKNKKSFFSGLLFITLFIAFVIYFTHKHNLKEIMLVLATIDIKYVIIGLLFMFIFVMSEALNIKILLKSFDIVHPFLLCFKYSLIGYFFSSITPSSSGGQPLQILVMKKDGIKLTYSITILLVILIIYQFLVCILGIVGFLIHRDFLLSLNISLKIFLFAFFLFNMILLIILLVLLFSKRVTRMLLNILNKVLSIFNYRKKEEFISNIEDKVLEYHNSAIYLKQHKKDILKVSLVTLVQLLIYFSIPFLVYKAFGLHDKTLIYFVGMEAFLYASVSCMPMPGAMGAHESVFMYLFATLFPVSMITSATIVSRGISFYLFVLISGFLILIFKIFSKKH